MNVKDNLKQLFQAGYDQDSWLIELRRLFPGIELFSRSQVAPQRLKIPSPGAGSSRLSEGDVQPDPSGVGHISP